MIKVLIADDHAVVRQGIKQILANTADITVVGEAANGQEVITKLGETRVDVVILDITMPESNGLQTLAAIKRAQPRLPVIVLSVHDEDQYGVQVIRSGASGYVTKECAPDQLVAAIRKAVMGGRYLSPTLAEKLEFARTDLEKPHEALSDREFEVLCLIGSGKTNREIAEQLSLSQKTISTYRSHILEKMNMKNNGELIVYALRQGLVDVSAPRS
jgi:two-component system invasion response regulator UvrY